MAAAGDAFDFAKIVQASSTYDDAHRGLLKILIDRGSLTEKAFCTHFVRCYATQHFLDEIDWDNNELKLTGVTAESVAKLRKQLLDIMNEKLESIGLRLMKAHDEAKNKKMIVLVSERHYSPAMAGASPFDTNELFLVVSWLEEMVKPDNDGYMPINEALRSARALPVPLKMEKAQQLIDQLFKEDWVRIEAGDMLTLTTRALTELGPILRSRYHASCCCLCTNVIIRKASMLSCDVCDALIHVSCWTNFAGAASDAEKVRCPGNNCKNMLKKDEMAETIKQIEEARVNPAGNARRARLSSSSEPGPSKKKATRGRKTGGKKSATMESDEEEEEVMKAADVEAEEEEDSEDEVFVKRTRKQPRRSSVETSEKQPRKKSKEDDDEEEDDDDEELRGMMAMD